VRARPSSKLLLLAPPQDQEDNSDDDDGHDNGDDDTSDGAALDLALALLARLGLAGDEVEELGSGAGGELAMNHNDQESFNAYLGSLRARAMLRGW
jgi:hypothetical protein